jgi:hypothetical protein
MCRQFAIAQGISLIADTSSAAKPQRIETQPLNERATRRRKLLIYWVRGKRVALRVAMAVHALLGHRIIFP